MNALATDAARRLDLLRNHQQGFDKDVSAMVAAFLSEIAQKITAVTGATGADGEDGREIELQASLTHIQWRYVGDVSWTNLVALSAITGPAGADGADGATGPTGPGAVGKQSIWIPAGAMTARTTNGAAAGSTEMSSNKEMVATLDFDTGTTEYAQFTVAMPKSWDGNPFTFQPYWSHASTTTNFGVVWQLAAVAISDADALDTAFGTAVSVTDTGGTTNTLYIGASANWTDAKRLELNARWRADWSQYAAALVDYAADSRFSEHTETYFVDGAHENQAGADAMAEIFLSVVPL